MLVVVVVAAAVVSVCVASPTELHWPAEFRDNTPCRDGRGRCVAYYLCPHTTFTDPPILTKERECPKYIELCCVDPTAPVTPDAPPSPNSYQPTCGQRQTSGPSASHGLAGNETQFGEFPWVTAILKKDVVSDEEINLYQCGGSLIHPSIVLTAAHCVNNHEASSLHVRLGEWDSQNEYEPYKHQDRDVQNVVIHPGNERAGLINNFALLYLQTPAILSKNVGIICLDPTPSVLDAGHSCILTGWGKDRFGKKGLRQNVLKKVDLPTYDFNKCQKALRRTRLGIKFTLDKSFLCVGGEEGKSSCSGDGGSPLVCLDAERQQYVQIGINAWNNACDSDGIPGVFVDVLYGYDWIVAQADKLLLDQKVDQYWK